MKPALKWVLTLAMVFAALLLGCEKTKQPTPPPPDAGTALLVANQTGAGALTVVDLVNQSIRIGAAGLGNIPNDILASGSKIYVINSGSNDMNVLRISNQNVLSPLDTFDLGRANGLSPQYGALASNGEMYISNFNSGTVTVLDTSNGDHLVYIPVGRGPQDVLAVGDKVYVCNSNYNSQTHQYDQGTLSVISTVNHRVIYTLAVGTNPQFMALDGSRNLHIVCTGDYVNTPGQIVLVNTRADTVANYINIGGTPGDIAITGNGLAYIAAGGPQGGPGEVYRYNTSTHLILNGPTGAQAGPIQVSANAMRVIAASDNSVYVSCYEGDRVDHIVGGARTESYVVGDGPAPMTIFEH